MVIKNRLAENRQSAEFAYIDFLVYYPPIHSILALFYLKYSKFMLQLNFKEKLKKYSKPFESSL